ncbi:MAG: aldo/keto reductase, partial [Corynebacterium kroppenstedtii]|nr:aldo/keto reductase [Corynebacterium kroppenstedtii]
ILHQSLPSHLDLTLDAYRGLESLLNEGRVRAIGVSNFLPEHHDKLIEETEVVPAVNQVEIYPYFRNTETLEADAKHGVLSQAWSPIGGIVGKKLGSRVAYPTGFHRPLTIVAVGLLLTNVTSTKSLSDVSSVQGLKWISSIRYHVA